MAAGSTYTPIATTTLGSATASYTFSSLGSYTDIILVYAGSGTSVNTQAINYRFNSDSGANYSYTYIRGDGTSATSSRTANGTFLPLNTNNTNTSQSNAILQIMNYRNTSTYKTTLARGNDPAGRLEATVGLWLSTSAITSITLIPESGTLNSGDTFTIYGILAA